MFDVSIQILCTRKPGTLSRLIRDIKLLGLQYSEHNIAYMDDTAVITVKGTGKINCSREQLIDMLTNMPEIISVQELTIKKEGEEVQTFRTQNSNNFILSSETLTPAVLLTAEKRLAEILGPVATYLVEEASSQSKNAGQLFNILAEELNSELEKNTFLSILQEENA